MKIFLTSQLNIADALVIKAFLFKYYSNNLKINKLRTKKNKILWNLSQNILSVVFKAAFVHFSTNCTIHLGDTLTKKS